MAGLKWRCNGARMALEWCENVEPSGTNTNDQMSKILMHYLDALLCGPIPPTVFVWGPERPCMSVHANALPSQLLVYLCADIGTTIYNWPLTTDQPKPHQLTSVTISCTTTQTNKLCPFAVCVWWAYKQYYATNRLLVQRPHTQNAHANWRSVSLLGSGWTAVG